MAQTHYEVLGIPPNSTAQEIRSAYRRLVLKHHPDHSNDPKSRDILVLVVGAYGILSDKGQRKAYDESLAFEGERARARQREAQTKKVRQEATTERASAKAKATRVAFREAITVDLLTLTKLFNTGRYEDAERLARNILSRNKNEAIPYSVLGDIARARGNMEAAVSCYAQAIQCDPNNPIYARCYEQLLRSTPADLASERSSSAAGAGGAMLGVGACVCACAYIALSKEAPLAVGIGLISTWTLGLVVMLFLSGVCVGVALCLAGKLDRFNAVSITSQGKVSPAMALGTIAVVNFWVAAALYTILGASQNAFNYSTSRVVGGVTALVLLASLSAHFSASISGIQVLAWGGNLSYIGAICGWMVSDSLKR